MIQGRLVGLIQPDVARAGGVSETRDIAALAHAFHVGYAPHVGWSGAICAAASLQLAAAMPAFVTFECMVPANPLRQSLTTAEVGAAGSLHDGRLAVPQGPGLGIEMDWDAVERNRTRP
jgi:galactonate dehydratase